MTQDEINAVKKAAEKMRKQESAQDEIIEMAREAGFMMENSAAIQAAEIFAKLVAAKEQKKWQDQTAVEIHEAVLEETEACAKVADTALALSVARLPLLLEPEESKHDTRSIEAGT